VAIYFEDGTNETHTGRRRAISRIEKKEEWKRDLMLEVSSSARSRISARP